MAAMRVTRSKRWMRRAIAVTPGGVNSPVRAFGSVGGVPRVIARASGARIEDVDGNRYVDYVASWGAIIAGHAHPVVVEAVRAAAARGMSFGAPTTLEVELAERITQWIPSVERIRFVSSGTEAVMSAVRLARGATGRERILKFEGAYHGHSNELLAAAGSGVATLGIPGTAGVTRGAVADTLVVPFNDLEAVEAVFRQHGSEIAALIVEPIAGNMGMVEPEPGFLEGLRRVCTQHGALLIFDEVITGFRVGRSGAQGRYGVRPDLSCFAKVIGGGMPVGAYGGRADLMAHIAPEGPVFQAGTLSGNPVAMSAGMAVLDLLERPGAFDQLSRTANQLASGLLELAKEQGIPFVSRSVGGLVGFFFHPGPVRSYAEAAKSDMRRFRSFFHAMLDQGIYLAPSAYESAFVTLAHGDAEIAETLDAARRAFRKAQ
jgi:glutamate-1-semialdehyde 2,1-aminomutase